jgi:hypothetical protein
MVDHPPDTPPSSPRAHLDVPFAEKDEAKRAGARWDPRARRWFDPRPPTPGLQRWAPAPPPGPSDGSARPAITADLHAALTSTAWHGGPDDLTRNAAGIGITHEAARRRRTEGAGADRSWRVGADGEHETARVLAALTAPSRLGRLRGRAPGWRVLHSVPIGTGRADVDHVLIGPPGVITINTKHHPKGMVVLDGERLTVNGHRSDYIAKARREAERAAELLRSALAALGRDDIAAGLRVRAVLAVVGARVVVRGWADGVSVLMPRDLVPTLTSMSAALDPGQVDVVHGVARHRGVWTR